MNFIPIHKIVIGVAVIAIFGVGISVVAVNAKRDSQVALNVPATPLGQSGTDATAPALSAPTELPTDSTATPGAPPAVLPVVAPAPAASATGKVANAKNGADRNVTTRSSDATSNIRVASAAYSNRSDSGRSSNEPASAPSLSEVPVSPIADTQPAAVQMGQEVARDVSPTATSPGASDSQITTDVKSEIAVAAPNSNVGVTTTNGVVALAGSVPSQDAVEQATQAARGVAGVKYVNVSALTVSDQ